MVERDTHVPVAGRAARRPEVQCAEVRAEKVRCRGETVQTESERERACLRACARERGHPEDTRVHLFILHFTLYLTSQAPRIFCDVRSVLCGGRPGLHTAHWGVLEKLHERRAHATRVVLAP